AVRGGRAGGVRVSAVAGDGKPVRADVVVTTSDGRQLAAGFAFEDAAGATFSPTGTLSRPAFLVPPPPPGRYRVEFTADGFFPQGVDAQVVRGGTTRVAVALVRR